MENEILRLPPLWEHALTNLLGHDHTTEPGMALRQWVHHHHQGIHHLMDLLSTDPEELKTDQTQQVYSIDDHGQGIYLRTSQVQICGLLTYIKIVFQSYNSGIESQDNPFHPFLPDEWSQHTSSQMRMYLVQNLPDPHGPAPVPYHQPDLQDTHQQLKGYQKRNSCIPFPKG